jgi:hypothetical protein
MTEPTLSRSIPVLPAAAVMLATPRDAVPPLLAARRLGCYIQV